MGVVVTVGWWFGFGEGSGRCEDVGMILAEDMGRWVGILKALSRAALE